MTWRIWRVAVPNVEAAARHLTARLNHMKARPRTARKPSSMASTNNAATNNNSKGTTKGAAHSGDGC